MNVVEGLHITRFSDGALLILGNVELGDDVLDVRGIAMPGEEDYPRWHDKFLAHKAAGTGADEDPRPSSEVFGQPTPPKI